MRRTEFNDHPFVLTIERILTMQPKMTEDEKQALEQWEKINLGRGGKGTSDWPGWKEVCARLSH